MVLIPIGLYKITVDNDIHFNQLEKGYMPKALGALKQSVFRGIQDDVYSSIVKRKVRNPFFFWKNRNILISMTKYDNM